MRRSDTAVTTHHWWDRASHADAEPAATAAADAPPRRRSLGMGMATALVVGNMVGSGVFLLPASLAAYGGISLVGWGVTAVGAMALALVFARLGRANPRTGGPYAHSREAFGDFMSFQTAWSYWIAVWAGNAAIAVAFVGYVGYFWESLATNRALAAAVALAAIWLLTAVNAVGVRQGGRVQAVTTVLKLVPLVAIGVVGVVVMDTGNFGGFNPSGDANFGALSAVAALTLWAFIGLESATVPAEDVADPERTIPRSTILGTAIAAVVYIRGTAAVMGAIPAGTLAGSTAPFADAAEEIFGSWAGTWVAAGSATSSASTYLGNTLSSSTFAPTCRASRAPWSTVVATASAGSLQATGMTTVRYMDCSLPPPPASRWADPGHQGPSTLAPAGQGPAP